MRARPYTHKDAVVLSYRRAEVLRKMALMSEASAARPADPNTANVKVQHIGKSAPPPGVDLTRSIAYDGPPSKRLSLHAHYAHRLQEAEGDYWRTLKIIAQAEVDVEHHQGRWLAPTGGTEADKVANLLRDYKGFHSAEVAAWEACSEKWVRRQRVLNGVEPDFGDEPDRDAKRAKIMRMVQQGASQRTIAGELGVTQGTISKALAAA